jgi:hypothetical protein
MKDSSAKSSPSRRAFVRSSAFGAAMAGPGFGSLFGVNPALAQSKPTLNDSDAAVLQFLAAAELVETDLWGQYAELANYNLRFRAALEQIDESLPDYISGDFEDEHSHANLINAYLSAAGRDPVNLDVFRTLPSAPVEGAKQIGRLTNLTGLTIDTSYYHRYRARGNPDFGDSFKQIVQIANLPTIPTSDSLSDLELQSIAETAAFHFAAIEQGGSSLYNSLSTKVSGLDVLSILTSIGPTEVYHFAVFQTVLEQIGKLGGNKTGGPQFPDIRTRPHRGDIMPEPCTFLEFRLPRCSVIRPRNTDTAGAVATAAGLVNSGLFKGQSQAFFDAVIALAKAADAAVRSC